MSIEVAGNRKMALSLVAGLLLAASTTLALVSQAQAQGIVEGKQYARIKPVAVESGKKIEVIEFFSYGCPHCGEFEPTVQEWLKSAPADVSFRRIPVNFQPRWVNLAKGYYTLEAMGEDQKLSPELFSAIHSKGLALWDSDKFFDWAATKGLDRKKVEDLFNSFTISGKVNRATQLAQVYNIQEVPTVIVDGKFITSPGRAGSHAATPAVINELIAKARAERPKS